MLGGLLGEINLHLPFYVAAALSAANFVYGYFFVPESLPPGRAPAFRLARINPFAALMQTGAPRRKSAAWCSPSPGRRLRQMMLQSTWVLYTTFRFDWTPRHNGIALFCVGLARPSCRPACWAS